MPRFTFYPPPLFFLNGLADLLYTRRKALLFTETHYSILMRKNSFVAPLRLMLRVIKPSIPGMFV